jgi:hypothetical protein
MGTERSSRMAKIPRYECEMCGERRLNTLEDTVCEDCDKKLIAADKVYFAKFEETRPKRQCRDCGRPCEASRYFLCEKCDEPWQRETEDPYIERADHIDDVTDLMGSVAGSNYLRVDMR